MARIAKSGLEYFPFDIDFFQDIRIRKLIKRQGGKAVTVYALLLCLIYKNGYYMRWDNELPFICSETTGFDEAYISEVIKTCLSLGLFDKALYESEDILTSKGIQARYCNIQRLNKRMGRIEKFSLLEEPQRNPVKPDKPKPKASGKSRRTLPAAPKVPAAASEPEDNATWIERFFDSGHRANLDLLCKNFGLGYGETGRLRALAESVVAEWELSHTKHRDYSDWSRHLISAMRIKNRDAASSPKDQPQQSTPPESDYSFKGGFGGQDI